MFEFGSDDSINVYNRDPYTIPPPFQPMPNFACYGSNELLFHSPHLNYRRHSSYSHEDILHMKYQNPPVDPRYRDSRPFVRSSSNIYDNARRDFMSRRRSSSSLQDDILRPFQQIQLNEYLRKSSPTINRTRSNSPATSDKSNSINWNSNPTIFIEEYNDNQSEVKSNNSSTNLSTTIVETHEPLNEDTVAPFTGSDEIPFIDDENIPITVQDVCTNAQIDNNIEEFNEFMCIHQRPLPPPIQYAKNRKTVSFDLMDSTEELNKLRRVNNINLNKSNTCDHITNIKLNKMRNIGTQSLSETDDSYNEPIFKFCTYKNSIPNPSNRLKSFREISSLNSDNFSAYFDGDGSIDRHQECHRPPPPHLIDTKAMTLDLSDLNSDTTSTSTQAEHQPDSRSVNVNIDQTKCVAPATQTKNMSKFAYITTWKPPPFFNKMHFGHGKVQALKNYFEKLKFSDTNSKSTPDLRNENDQMKLTSPERHKVLTELQEWSEFGTKSKTSPHATTQNSISTNPITRSVFNLTVTTSINDKNLHTIKLNERCQSEPDVSERKKFPDAYIVRKQKVSTNICTHHKVQNSCPNLNETKQSNDKKPFVISSRLKTNIYNSPCHRSTYTTLRQIKKNQKLNRTTKCCRHRNECNSNDVANQTDGNDEPR